MDMPVSVVFRVKDPGKGASMRSEQEVNRAIDQYSDMILRLCMVYLKNSTDAEDIFQTVFLKYTLYDRPFENEEHEKAWLIRVTVNACKDWLKSFFHSRTISMEELNGYAPSVTSEQYTVMEAVWSLPKQYRDVIYLHYYEGYKIDEISEILNLKQSNIKSLLSRGRKKLKEYMEENGYELVAAEFTRLPNVDLKVLEGDAKADVEKLIERIEEDDDVQNVYTTMQP